MYFVCSVPEKWPRVEASRRICSHFPHFFFSLWVATCHPPTLLLNCGLRYWKEHDSSIHIYLTTKFSAFLPLFILKNGILCVDFSRTVKKLLTILCFYNFENLWQCTVQKYFTNQCLKLQRHVSRAHRYLNCSNISYSFWDMTSNVMKILENLEMRR